MEHTGDYYICNNCKHIYDFNDWACPECGSNDFMDISVMEIKEIIEQNKEENSRLKKMLKSHDDYSEKEPIT